MTSHWDAPLILRTRLHRPAVSEDHLQRSRLLERLTGNPNRAFTLVIAPAGFGKTTLVSSWLSTCERPSAWVSLDESVNSLPLFLSYLAAAIQSIFPESCPETQALLRAPRLPAEILTNTFIDEVADLPRSFILALDDYHLVRDEAIHQFVDLLIRQHARTLHLVLIARTTPPLSLSKLRAAPAQLLEIRARDLRFTADETRTFTELALGAPIVGVNFDLLEERTEGWAAGLRMAVLAMQGHPDLRASLSGFRGTSARVLDYLTDQVIASQPPAIVNMLIRTSILDRFCASLCDAVCDDALSPSPDAAVEDRAVKDRSTGRAFLERIERTGLFVVPLDERREWYRYHHLFQELLVSQAQAQLGKAELKAAHARASAWFAGHGYVEEAVRHALAADDVEGAARFVERQALASCNQEDQLALHHYLALLPEAIKQVRPALLLAQAWLLHFQGKFQLIPELLERIEACLTRGDHDLKGDMLQVVQGGVDALWSQHWERCCEYQRSFEHAQRALACLPPANLFARRITMVYVTVACLAAGRSQEQERLLLEQLERAQGADTYTVGLSFCLCILYLFAADYKQLKRAANHMLVQARAANLPASVGWAHYFLGLMNYERDDLDAAARHFAEVVAHRHVVHFQAAQDCLYRLALTQQAQGRQDKAGETLELLAEFNSEILGFVSDHARLAEARLALLQGDTESAAAWALARPLQPTRDSFTLLDTGSALQASILIAQNTEESLEKALRLLDSLRQTCEATFNTRQLIEVLALQAMALDAQGRSSDALDALQRALSLGRPGGFIRRFVELGAPMADLLNRLAARDNALATSYYVQRLRSAFARRGVMEIAPPAGGRPQQEGDRKGAPLPTPTPRIDSPVTLLTYRELEVLNLLTESLSDDEIARRLFIAPSTVKRHTGSIYRKLGVRNRRQAVTRARALEILR